MHQALHWRAVIDSEDVSNEDRAAFDAWVNADPAHREALEEARSFWAELSFLKDLPTEQPRRNTTRVISSERPTQPSFHLRLWTSAAAIVLVTATIAWPVFLGEPEVEARHVATNTGERLTVALDDGSYLTLDARSSISVVTTEHERLVELIAGSAYFDVAQERRPFIVTSGSLMVEVTGTRFSVQRSSHLTQVAVAEGSVDVSSTSPGPSATLKRGERVVSDQHGRLGRVVPIPPASVAAWRTDRLVYEEAPLSLLISDLNRYRDKPVELLDSKLAAKTITATFDASGTEVVLSTLERLYPIQVFETAHKTELRRRD